MSGDGPFVVRLTGELDIGTKDLLRAALHAPTDSRSVLLDLTTVTYADSTALAE